MEVSRGATLLQAVPAPPPGHTAVAVQTSGCAGVLGFIDNFRSRLGDRAIMKTQRIALGLTVLNLLILGYSLFRASTAASMEVAPVLRARALEIVDDNGRVRAMLRVFPASPNAKIPTARQGTRRRCCCV